MSVIVMKMPKQQQPDSVSLTSTAAVITSRNRTNRCRSFHFRYLDLCRSKNTAPIGEIRKNNKDQATLDFFGDKLSYTDWQLIKDALNCDQMLRNLSLRLRKSHGGVDVNVDTEKKAKSYRLKPVIYAKIVFTNVINAVSNCIEANKNLTVLHLEGLPLSDYVETIVKALSTNKSIKDVSFARSNIYDTGCGSICNTFKYLENVQKLNLSDTGLTTKGAEHVANMIKIQKISRYTEGWQQSLRYKEIDTNAIAGLRTILLARNPQIGDEGLDLIAEVLKEDVWVKVIDMENCGLTDRAANVLIDCLKVNDYITEFNVSSNPGISKFLLRKIGAILRKDILETDGRTGEELLRDFSEGRANSSELAKNTKLSTQLLIDQFKKTNEQLQLERHLRLKAEELNEKLTAQVRAYEMKLNKSTMNEQRIPDGYVIVTNESLQSLIKERNNLHSIVLARRGVSHHLHQQPDRTHYLNQHEIIYDEDETSPPESEIVKNLNYLIHQGENGIQFLTPLPEPSGSATISARSDNTAQHQLSAHHAQLPTQATASQIRKVKSEMKYIEIPTRSQHVMKKKDTKSDYDYATESDVPRFESNIGDTVANMTHNQQQQLLQQQQQQQQQYNTTKQNNTSHHNHIITNSTNNSTSIKSRSVRYASNVQISKKYELDDISLPTTRSRNSVASSTESDTLRCSDDQQQHHITADFRSLLQRQHTQPMEHGQGEGGGAAGAAAGVAAINATGAAMPAAKRSPRSLFLGLCEQ